MELRTETDYEVLGLQLLEKGWTLVSIESTITSIDVDVWIENNIKGEYLKLSSRYIFKHAQDAFWFSLRWTNS